MNKEVFFFFQFWSWKTKIERVKWKSNSGDSPPVGGRFTWASPSLVEWLYLAAEQRSTSDFWQTNGKNYLGEFKKQTNNQVFLCVFYAHLFRRFWQSRKNLTIHFFPYNQDNDRSHDNSRTFHIAKRVRHLGSHGQTWSVRRPPAETEKSCHPDTLLVCLFDF